MADVINLDHRLHRLLTAEARVEALEKALHECEQAMTYLAETVPLVGWTPVRDLDEQLERIRLAGAAARKLLEHK